jgi:folate-binding protein YgfZ
MSVETGVTPDLERVHNALRTNSVFVDRSDRMRMRFTGAKAAESLNGLLTNDVTALAPGQGQYAAALTPKGKVIADVRLFVRAGEIFVDVGASAAPGWSAMIRKFVNPRLAKYEDVSQQVGDVGIFGANARGVVRAVFPDALIGDDMAPYASVSAATGADALWIARVPDFGVEGYEIFGPPADLDAVRQKLSDEGAIEVSQDALHVARIEAGRPEWGVDMDDSVLAQEADMDRLNAISYTKGCYTGQETVARVHFRGHVNRLLRGLRFAGPRVPPSGADVQDADGKVVGTTRSGALSPQFGAIALGLVRREVEPGGVVRVNVAGDVMEATVVALPFDAGAEGR